MILSLGVAAGTMLAVGCDGESSTTQRLRSDGDDRGNDDGNGTGSGNGDGPNGSGTGSYDPEAPTNQGPGHNKDGFSAIQPILQRQCSECHHAGTWLDLLSAADAQTANKIVREIETGKMPPAPRDAVSADDLAKIKTWRDGQTPPSAPPQAPTDDPSNIAVTQLLTAAQLASYKAALPSNVAWPRLAKILAAPSTLFWDKRAIPPAYQDTVGDGAGVPLGARFNNAGRSLIVPEGKKLFSEDGSSWSFPFGHTAGADASDNAVIVNFVNLPEVDGGKLAPIVYRVETSTTGGLPVRRWNWSFPKGTVVGEIIMIRDGASALLTTEIRVRERFADRWATNSFRPFVTAKSLAGVVKQKKPDWQSTPALATVVGALDNASTLTAKRLTSPAFSNLVTLEGFVDAPLPSFEDDALVRDLLKTKSFVGAYGTAWKESGAQKAFGATGPQSATRLSIVARAIDTGLLEVRESTCEKCHNQGGYFIGDLVDQAILYGDVWGVDRIFSFHPFEPTRIDASGNENRSVRTPLAAIVVPYDAAKHPASRYTFYRPAK